MPGSSTTPGRPGTRVAVPVRVAFRLRNGVGAQGMNLYGAQWLAYALPYRRFAAVLTDCVARSGPIWIATPSSYRTCTDCSLPVRHLWKRISACLSRSFLISMRATIRCIRFQGGDEADFVARGRR